MPEFFRCRIAAPILLTLLCIVPRLARAEGPAPLVVEATIPIEKTGGRIDHMAADPARQRLIVAELGNDSVDIVDLAARAVIHRIDGLKEPQGVGYDAAADIVAVANGGDGSLRLFRASDFAPLTRLELGKDADNLRIDPRDGRIVVGYGEGKGDSALAFVSPDAKGAPRRLPLPAHPEGFQLHPKDGRIYVNIPEAGRIAVVDTAAGKEIAAWKLPELGGNFPMALDEGAAVLASVFRNPPRLVLLDADKGAVLASVDTCGDADDVFFDSKRHRIYVSCGAGAVDVFQQGASGLPRLARIKTESGARTSLFVASLDRLYVAAPAGLIGSRAAILVLKPQP